MKRISAYHYRILLLILFIHFFIKGYDALGFTGHISSSETILDDAPGQDLILPRQNNYTNTVQIAVAPTITVDSNLDTFNAEVGEPQPSSFLYYFLDAENLSPYGVIRLGVNDPSNSFKISLTGNANDFSNTLEITTSQHGWLQTTIYVKYEPTAAGSHTATITHTGDGAETQTLTLQGNAVTPMPVELVSFRANASAPYAVLNWATASEDNNSHFEIELTNDIKSGFKKIGSVDSKNSNSSVLTKYSFRHILSGDAGTCYFRLKQVDLNGTYTYSNVISLDMPQTNHPDISVFPNPVTHATQINLNAIQAGALKLKISDMHGSEVLSRSHSVKAGNNSFNLDMNDDIPSGMYIITTEYNNKLSRIRLLKN